MVSLPDRLAVDEYSLDTAREHLRLFESRAINDALRIEDDEIGFHPFAYQSTIHQPETTGRSVSHLAHGFLKTQPVLLADEAAKHARERACASRVARAYPAVAGDHHPGLAVKRANIRLLHRAPDNVRAAASANLHVN